MQEDRLFILSDSAGPQSAVDPWLVEFNAELEKSGLPLSTLFRFEDATWPPRVERSSCALVVFPTEGVAPDHALAPATRNLMKKAHRHHLPILVLSDHRPADVCAGIRGLTVLPSDTTARTASAVLNGALSRTHMIHQLQMQNEINDRIIEKVTDEIDLMDEELQSAMLVQKALLPQELPCFKNLSMAAFWRPSSYVSGDFYQAQMLDETRMGVFLADAAGHGVASALMTMIMAKSFEPWSVDGAILSTGMVMRKINDALCKIERSRSRFATGIYVIIDCKTGELTYSTAGHPAPLVLNGESIRGLDLEDGGPGMGIFEDSEFETMHGTLEAGESLLMYSDGFEQAFPMPDVPEDALHLPNNAYLRVFKSLAGLGDPAAMIERLETAIDGRRGSLRQKDDLTLLCVHHATQGVRTEVA